MRVQFTTQNVPCSQVKRENIFTKPRHATYLRPRNKLHGDVSSKVQSVFVGESINARIKISSEQEPQNQNNHELPWERPPFRNEEEYANTDYDELREAH